MIALGIDIGSTSIKGAVLDLATSTVQTLVSRPFPTPEMGLPGGWIEINPLQICSLVDELLLRLVEHSPEAELLCFSGQMGGLILLDEQAKPLTNYISWRDQRTLSSDDQESVFSKVGQQWEAAGCLTDLGQELQAGSTTVLLAWLNWHQQLPKNGVPHTIADFVVSRLVGQAVPMHATHAIGMIDLNCDQWHHAAFEAIGIQQMRLPQLTFTESCVGETRVKGTTLQVFGSYGDQQCALRGAGLQRDELSLNISTGSQVSRRVAIFQPGNYQSRKYFFGDTLDTVTHLPAGRSLQTLIDLLTEIARAHDLPLANLWDTINQKVDSVADSDLQVDLAFFQGPCGSRGRIENISTENLSVGTLFHAAYRAMADNYVSIAERFTPRNWNRLVVSGGLIHSTPRLKSLLKERFFAPLRQCAEEETMLGLLDIAKNSTTHLSRREG
jgi:sugar (pentulose or hexulose) kinase